ncbi:MAG: family 10 glycosylhydrolase [Clostridia bacterium]|nr:family 10 glycosylhydrolase [Clostridia bacterium]
MTHTIRSCTALLAMVAVLLTAFGLFTTAPSVSAAKIGDLNADGKLTTTDVRLYLKSLISGGGLTASQQKIADYDGDGVIDTTDSRTILLDTISGRANEVIRGFWIPYMEVADLISSGNVATAKSKIDACLQDCADKGANTVYFHVRANNDAYYNSSVYTPTSKTKTLLNAGFDPLAYAVERSHALGMKIEAWINPYRIGTSIANVKSSNYFKFGSLYYYVPSSADVQDLVVRGVREVVQNYDIDGVQFDDYFYPRDSVSTTAAESFEQADYTAYKNGGGTLAVADWRRYVVHQLVAKCYAACHEREGCVFGISPSCDFEANYDSMYADAAFWAKNPGYVDYLAPQLYVGYNHAYTPFAECLADWDALTRHGRVKMVAGLALYKTGLLDDTWAGTNARYEWLNNNNMMARQVATTKTMHWDGVAYYSHQSFTVDSTRNATVANADMASATEAWLTFQ